MKWDAGLYDVTKGPQKDAGRELLVAAGIRETDSVLDVGCGTGELTVMIASLAHKGNVTGIDSSTGMLELAGRKTSGIGNLRFHQTPVEEMGFKGEFDIAFSNSALHWVLRQEEAVVRIHRALRPGGRIAFQLPHGDAFQEIFAYTKEAIGEIGLEAYFEGFSPPWFLPSDEEYASMLGRAGFRELDVRYREYRYIFESVNDVIEWWASAGLRPYMNRLPKREQAYFTYAVAMRFEQNRTPEGIALGFRRLFAFGRAAI